MAVCSSHSGFEEKLRSMGKETQEMHNALIGDDMQSGLVKKVADIDAKLDLFLAEQKAQKELTEQKKKEKSAILKGLAAIGVAVASLITALAAWFRGS
jgi:hypothetical protein